MVTKIFFIIEHLVATIKKNKNFSNIYNQKNSVSISGKISCQNGCYGKQARK
jgi:hypothetical protein